VSRERVLIADDHAVMRDGVRAALEAGGFAVCADVGDGPSAVAAALRHRPEVCLLDINMPGGGIAAAQAIAEGLPETAVVMLTVSRDDADLFAALQAGAAGYLIKDIEPSRLPEALRGVLAGEAVLPRALVARIVDEFHGRRRRLFALRRGGRGEELSDREWEVLDLMRDGLPTREIGSRLGISPVTVRRHASEIVRKLRVPDRAAAIRLMREREG
jgi:DNA-binding NarL/FixJ family response regulator